MRIELSKKAIPRNAKGDCAFTTLGTMAEDAEFNSNRPKDSALAVFTPTELVELVNRAVYQLEYQRVSHVKRQQQRTELERPIKRAFKELYPHEPFSKATEEQLKCAIQHLAQRPELRKEEE